MKILISAYSCEPYKGSEPGIAWNFSLAMSKYHELHIITTHDGRENIEKEMEHIQNNNIHFHYYDIPKALSFWATGPRSFQLYYIFWQIFTYFKFKNFINNGGFDIVHHLTFGANWMPSLLMMTKPTAIWGSVGSEDVYLPVLKSLPFRSRVKEFTRSLVKNYFFYISPMRWLTVLKADLILEHSSKYARYNYPKFLQYKIRKHIQTGLNTNEPEYKEIIKMKARDKSSPIILIIASELKAWKGVLIAAEVFARVAMKHNNIELVILGEGPEKKRMQNIFSKYGVNEKVTFKGYVSKHTLMKELYEADILLYPAYHHGLATIILQAMYAYLPVVSMKGDIISEVVDGKCGLAAGGKTMDEIIVNLTKITSKMISDDSLRKKYSLNARKLLEEKYEWNKLVENMNKIYQEIVTNNE